ncbi:hypothetical protein Bca4012_066862 [Brassica carinata]|uniref:Uncharacterized protein n=1 Tax=Brassica carinata TaxID=52824 RepID=A0A8X7VRF6_BRACI|nr:hypothetical protein Bca52824_019138 [Brassica carinata]
MAFVSITKCCYTALEYEKMSTRQRALALSLLTIVMLFLMANASSYFHSTDKIKQRLLHGAGYSGLTFAAAASTDAFIRSKWPDVRIFDETSIIAIYGALWSLMALIFYKATFIFLLVCVGMILAGGALLRYLDLKYQHLNPPPLSRIRDEETRAFIEALSASHSPAAANALATMALFSAMTSPGELTTKVLIVAATKAISANPHAPDATAAANAQDPGCCYGFFSG